MIPDMLIGIVITFGTPVGLWLIFRKPKPKRCKDCKWCNGLRGIRIWFCWVLHEKVDTDITTDCTHYERKFWRLK
jgi:hypothetical protein